MTGVTVLGLGPMGQALSTALLDAGHHVTVWNRTESKADANCAHAAPPSRRLRRKPLRPASSTLINVVDHDAVDAVLEAAGEAVDRTRDRRPEFRHTRPGPSDGQAGGGSRRPVSRRRDHDADNNDRDAKRQYSFRRSAWICSTVKPQVFGALGTAAWLGEDHGRAAAFDMSLLDLFWTSVSGFLHAVTVARANGIAPGELLAACAGHRRHPPADLRRVRRAHRSRPARRQQRRRVLGGSVGATPDRGIAGRGCRRRRPRGVPTLCGLDGQRWLRPRGDQPDRFGDDTSLTCGHLGVGRAAHEHR